jgi:sporulation protein YlmC with PRC-barrel domain
MEKHAVIIVALVPEASEQDNEKIKKEMKAALEEALVPIPWLQKVEEITIVKPKKT